MRATTTGTKKSSPDSAARKELKPTDPTLIPLPESDEEEFELIDSTLIPLPESNEEQLARKGQSLWSDNGEYGNNSTNPAGRRGEIEEYGRKRLLGREHVPLPKTAVGAVVHPSTLKRLNGSPKTDQKRRKRDGSQSVLPNTNPKPRRQPRAEPPASTTHSAAPSNQSRPSSAHPSSSGTIADPECPAQWARLRAEYEAMVKKM